MSKTTKIQNILETRLQKSGKRSNVTEFRLNNIRWIESLKRKGLSYGKKERQLLIHTTAYGEKIFIQYPGKESRKYTKNGKERKKSAIRPWDFRPELYLPENNSRHRSMSFADIWATIFEVAEELIKKNDEQIIRVLAILLYRMAFMLDHTKIETFSTKERNIRYGKSSELIYSKERRIKLPVLFKWSFNKEVLKYISDVCPRWGNMSLEAFLYYNELLAWNEDCKYYYRNHFVSKNEKWIGKTGRINTLLTHIHILGCILKDVPLAIIFSDFTQKRGISDAKDDKIKRICKGFIKTE